MAAQIIVLADRRAPPRQSLEAMGEIQRLKAYAQRYIEAGNLSAFTLAELEDMERLIVKHSMVIELLDENGDIADQQIIFID
jgi:hypothetical protein